MKPRDPSHSMPAVRRRGVTLIEMLITLAILLLMMTAIVKVFQAATGTLTSVQSFQEIDGKLRQIDTVLRSDLRGVTARFTPPLNPKDNLGYFEYIENSFADIQGEDTDDCLRFTAKAPTGKPFTGRCWPPYTNPQNGLQQPHPNGPITITSDYAEIIYFLRNGNLYRRVFLVAPDRQSSIIQMIGNVGYNNGVASYRYTFPPSADPFDASSLGVSWRGMNDLSARPANSRMMSAAAPSTIVLNTLGDTTNRENRAFTPRFGNDFVNTVGAPIPDGQPDDVNIDDNGNLAGDGVPDYYPTLTPSSVSMSGANRIVFEIGGRAVRLYDNNINQYQILAFPFIYPGAYTKPEPGNPTGIQNEPFRNGWIHSPTPEISVPFADNASAIDYLRRLNHNPLDLGDNLPRPSDDAAQTYWGFPTWRETLSANWMDPTVQVNDIANNPGMNPPANVPASPQPFGLRPRRALPALENGTANDGDLLPPMMAQAGYNNVAYPLRSTPQLYNDGFGASRFGVRNVVSQFWRPDLWSTTWEDDLIATNVRSFDVKALDMSLGQYMDLGWGDDLRFTSTVQSVDGAGNPFYVLPNAGLTATNELPYAYGNYDFVTGTFGATPAYLYTNRDFFDLLGQTMAHEGRVPPLRADGRYDAQFGPGTYALPAGNAYTGNVGDDTPAAIRLRRVWDTWSTDYTNAPARGVNPLNGFPIGPPFSPPVYPSYPPPYPAPLRGIQIQIRVTDPTNQRIKTLTIRQDFTDRL